MHPIRFAFVAAGLHPAAPTGTTLYDAPNSIRQVCSRDRLYHYLLDPLVAVEAILRDGLLPFSSQDARGRPYHDIKLGLYRDLYREFAEPWLKRPYENSGVFLTPIDFSLIEGHRLARLTRVALPLHALDSTMSRLTWIEADERVVRPLSPESLDEAASLWTAERVGEWFGNDRNRTFFFVPRVWTYQGKIPIEGSWVEGGVDISPASHL